MKDKNEQLYLDEVEEIKKEDRSPLVRDHDYGKITTYDLHQKDIPVYAEIKYSQDGEIIYENYDKLKEVLNEVIRKNVKTMVITNPLTNEREECKTIQGNALTKLKISELEMKYAIDYMIDNDIIVRGIDSSLDGEFDNYQYISTYKTMDLPPALTRNDNYELLCSLHEKKEYIEKNKDINSEELSKLRNQIKLIRNRLIEGNLRMVNHILYKRIPKDMKPEKKDELHQIAYETLIRFIDNYDPKKGYSLSTALYNYLMHNVWRLYDEQKNTVYVPVHMNRIIKKIKDVKETLEPILGRELTIKEIADEIYEKDYIVKEALKMMRIIEIESTDSYENSELEEQVYDHALDEDNIENEIDEIVDYDTNVLPEIFTYDEMLKSNLEEVLNTLTPEEKLVTQLVNGLEDGVAKSFSEVGKIMGIKSGNVRNIYMAAIRKMRHPKRSKKLEPFLDNYDNIEHRYGLDVKGKKIS